MKIITGITTNTPLNGRKVKWNKGFAMIKINEMKTKVWSKEYWRNYLIKKESKLNKEMIEIAKTGSSSGVDKQIGKLELLEELIKKCK